MTRRGRRRYQRMHREQPPSRLRTGLFALVVIAVILGLLAALLLPSALQSRDLQGALPRRAEAVVVDLRFAGGRTRLGATNPLVIVRMDGRDVQAIGLRSLLGLHRGQRVMLTYLVGRSGQVYIQDAEPLSVQ